MPEKNRINEFKDMSILMFIDKIENMEWEAKLARVRNSLGTLVHIGPYDARHEAMPSLVHSVL